MQIPVDFMMKSLPFRRFYH